MNNIINTINLFIINNDNIKNYYKNISNKNNQW